MNFLVKWVMRIAGIDRFGDGHYAPPEAKAFKYRVGNQRVITGKGLGPVKGGEYQVFASNNDGFELWMGWGNEWKYWLNQSEVRHLFWWILWEWYAKARWFGLRRPLYYWALKRKVSAFNRKYEDV